MNDGIRTKATATPFASPTTAAGSSARTIARPVDQWRYAITDTLDRKIAPPRGWLRPSRAPRSFAARSPATCRERAWRAGAVFEPPAATRDSPGEHLASRYVELAPARLELRQHLARRVRVRL